MSLRSLAASLGLSPTTISLVLNESPGSEAIPQETKDRVIAAARQQNYRPNFLARSLRAKRYPVRIDAVAEGTSGSLFKVRVGGFPTKDAADATADRLHGDGHNGTWVVRLAG